MLFSAGLCKKGISVCLSLRAAGVCQTRTRESRVLTEMFLSDVTHNSFSFCHPIFLRWSPHFGIFIAKSLHRVDLQPE